jgi:hypothetical protein
MAPGAKTLPVRTSLQREQSVPHRKSTTERGSSVVDLGSDDEEDEDEERDIRKQMRVVDRVPSSQKKAKVMVVIE